MNNSKEKAQTIDATIKVQDVKLDWDGPADPDNPHNWKRSYKWFMTILLSFVTFSSTFASSLYSAATYSTAVYFDVSITVATLSTSLYVAGFAFGPIMFGPISENFGRRNPLMFGILMMAIFHIPAALAQNIETLLIGRLLAGIGGSSPLAVIGGMMVDFWDPVNRGVAICGFASMTFAGPILSPIVGGFMIGAGLSWRWMGYLCIILGTVVFVLGIFVVPETHGPTLLRRRARKRGGNPERPKLDIRTILTVYLKRPFKMLFLEPILVLLTLYLSFIYGLVFLSFSAWPISFSQQRHWKQGVDALPFLSITIGVIIGCAFIIYVTKTRFARKMAQTGQVVPEERLPPMMLGAVLLPISLFWWAWTSNPNITWVPQVIAGIPFGCAVLMITLQGLNYIIDVYKMYANSGIAANTIVRCSFGAGFPLFATPMYEKLGVPWATSLLGFVSLAMVPIPFVFYIYGKQIRSWSKFTPT